MPDDSDDLSGEGADDAVADFDQLTESLFERVNEFVEDEDVAEEIVPLLLLRLSLTTCMMAYAMSTAKPSAGGLKLDLDRFRRDVEDMVREAKKDADRFIAEAKAAIEAQGGEEDET